MPKENIGDTEIYQPTAAAEPKPKKPAAAESDDDGFSSLATLSESERAAWLKNSEAPERLGKPEKPAKPVDEGQRILAGLDEETREKWLRGDIESGELVHQKRAKDAANAEKAAAEKSAGSEESAESTPESKEAAPKKHILARHFDEGGAINEQEHAAALRSERERWQTDKARYSDAEAVQEAGKKISVTTELQNVFAAIRPHLANPYTFYREFVMNPAFRAKIEGSDGKGLLRIAAEFDGSVSAPEEEEVFVPPKRVTSAPAPGRGGAGGGKSIAARDPVASALKNGDFTAYMNEMNQREAGR